MNAHEPNLLIKKFSELQVEGSDVLHVSQKEELATEAIDGTNPSNDSLKKVDILEHGGIEFPKWVGDPSYIHLKRVSIHGCKKCTSLPPLGQLPSLKELFIKGMDEVKFVGLELLGTSTLAFPSLEILSFEDMRGWEVWSNSTGIIGAVFPCLKKLRIRNCSNLVEVSLESLPCIRFLTLTDCGDGVLKSLVHVTSSITELTIDNIRGLTDEVWRGVMEYLGAVERVIIRKCNEIRYLWESEAEATKVLVNLRDLRVLHCENLVNLGDRETEEDNCGINMLTSLRRLHVFNCPSMEHLGCLNSVEIIIHDCASLTSFSFPTGGKNLRSLYIENCNKLLEKELGGEKINSRNMPMLESVRIKNSPDQKWIFELNHFIHLESLFIEGFPSLESFPDLLLPNLTSLKHLSIINCSNIDSSFPRGLWPPRLLSLGLGGLKKPISKWSPQNFPPSLARIEFVGEDVSSFSQLSHLLPSSLTVLDIREFKNLKSLSEGLQNLTSLQHLFIGNCPKLIRLPETLFPSMLSLHIDACPILKERCDGRGSYYWPLISHIPCINIDLQLQS